MISRPVPANEQVSHRMRQQRERNTSPETNLRRMLHSRGLRFRLHRRLIEGSRRETDIVFPSSKVAVFVDGCFWHGCPDHGSMPKSNAEFWRQKIEGNRERDLDTNSQLADAGWAVVRVWEHESPEEAAHKIEQLVRERDRR